MLLNVHSHYLNMPNLNRFRLKMDAESCLWPINRHPSSLVSNGILCTLTLQTPILQVHKRWFIERHQQVAINSVCSYIKEGLNIQRKDSSRVINVQTSRIRRYLGYPRVTQQVKEQQPGDSRQHSTVHNTAFCWQLYMASNSNSPVEHSLYHPDINHNAPWDWCLQTIQSAGLLKSLRQSILLDTVVLESS